ncbi:predicted protein [Uncinocarpus reesii 1704]|uniref:Uncharacterized protein n=1 Tax=Uncinocarpus reesii (strain UAMH 1704) TaxID=336963 RepID=C4JJ12_UNCRE|nr:uncharacterized protein UREG_01619 [Uncinocarpus reesii 1704]EEP76770.1 predicted protein [Uncinocarpus reesii 1704]
MPLPFRSFAGTQVERHFPVSHSVRHHRKQPDFLITKSVAAEEDSSQLKRQDNIQVLAIPSPE